MNVNKRLVFRVISFILVVLLVLGSSYIIDYVRFNDKSLVEYEVLKIQNKLLLDEIEEINNLKEIKGDYLIGKVVVRDIYGFYNEVIINVGSDDGISEGSAVLNSEGLVGVVSKVDNDKAYVKLLSGDYNVSVKINDIYGNLKNNKITLLDKYGKIEVGDKVYTTGYSNVAPNIYVGEVMKVQMDNNNLGQEVIVKLIDNKYLNYVSVMR